MPFAERNGAHLRVGKPHAVATRTLLNRDAVRSDPDEMRTAVGTALVSDLTDVGSTFVVVRSACSVDQRPITTSRNQSSQRLPCARTYASSATSRAESTRRCTRSSVRERDVGTALFPTRTFTALTRTPAFHILRRAAVQPNAHRPPGGRFTVSPHLLRHTFLRDFRGERRPLHAKEASGHRSDRHIELSP